MDPFATHKPVLEHAVKNTSGPVLEIGCGYGSTELLDNLCKGRTLITIETNREWYELFKRFASPTHVILWAESYDAFDSLVRYEDWSVVFIDHAPGERRNVEIAKAVNAKFVVIHDTHDPAYEYEKTLPLYKYQYKYEKLIPFTSVVSNVSELDIFNAL
jgi:predicted O-methyltransferase YrrM